MKVLIEGITYNTDKNQFDFNFKDDSKDDIMSLKYGSKTVKTTKKGKVRIFFSYQYNKTGNFDKSLIKKFGEALKNFNFSLIANADFNLFIQKGILGFAASYSNFPKIDLIITPQSSSGLANEIANRIKGKLSNALLVKDSFVKNSLDNIKVDTDAYLAKAKDPADRKKREYYLKYDWKKATEDGTFKIKKVHNSRRNLYKDYIVFNSETDRRVYNALNGGIVLLIDDYLTTGTTIVEMVNQINDFSPAEIVVYTLLKN